MKNKKYSIIYADPAWSYSDKAAAGKRGASFQYPVISMTELKNFYMIPHLSDDCACFMWVTAPMMPEQIKVLKAWGFRYKTIVFTWVKRAINGGYRWGMGNWSRSNAEYCVLGVRGNIKRVSRSVHSIVDEIPGRHSEKPGVVRDRIVELMGDLPRLEMFARERVEGWDCWGFEVDNDVEIGPKKMPPMYDMLRHLKRT